MNRANWPEMVDRGKAYHINFQFPFGVTFTLAVNKQSGDCILYREGKPLKEKELTNDLREQVGYIVELLEEHDLNGGKQ